MNPLKQIEQWHKDARPVVTDRDLTMAVAVHIEEFLEMLEQIQVSTNVSHPVDRFGLAMRLDDAEASLKCLYDLLRYGKNCNVQIEDREKLLDSLADQIVTAAGIGAAAGMNVPEAVSRVAYSNDTKRLADGSFARDNTGKITKPEHYAAPDLTGLY